MSSRARSLGFLALIAAVAGPVGCDEGPGDDELADEATGDDELTERSECIYGGTPPALDSGVDRYLSTGGCDLAMRQETEPNGTQWGRLHVIAAIHESAPWPSSRLDVIVWSRACAPYSGACGGWTHSAVLVDAEEGSPIGNTIHSVHTLRGSVALPANHNSFRIGTRAFFHGPPSPVPVHYYFTAS